MSSLIRDIYQKVFGVKKVKCKPKTIAVLDDRREYISAHEGTKIIQDHKDALEMFDSLNADTDFHCQSCGARPIVEPTPYFGENFCKTCVERMQGPQEPQHSTPIIYEACFEDMHCDCRKCQE